jgi:hypothetical protein
MEEKQAGVTNIGAKLDTWSKARILKLDRTDSTV